MTTSELFINKIDCCGCELCSASCPKSLIEMRADDEGFLYPYVIDDKACIHCNKCIKVCPMKSAGRSPQTIRLSYGGYVGDDNVVRTSSSGGYATAISSVFIEHGGVVYGVRYAADCQSVEYARAETLKDVETFKTSKYVQAHKGEVYSQVKNDLKAEKDVLFIGLPCECSALYHAVGEHDRLYTVSLICHGPTSQRVHREFCKDIMQHYGNNPIVSFSVRHKETGWKPYYIKAGFADGSTYLEQFVKTNYETAFKYLKRPSCSECKYKLGNSEFGLMADVILGDYHAVRNDSRQYNRWGVSQASALTSKGEKLLAMITATTIMEPITYEEISRTNIALRAAIPMSKNRDVFAHVFDEKGLKAACNISAIRREMWKKKAIKNIRGFLYTIKSRIILR